MFYTVTYGRGMGHFVRSELEYKDFTVVNYKGMDSVEGKMRFRAAEGWEKGVFSSDSDTISKIISLRTVEKAFIDVFVDKNVSSFTTCTSTESSTSPDLTRLEAWLRDVKSSLDYCKEHVLNRREQVLQPPDPTENKQQVSQHPTHNSITESHDKCSDTEPIRKQRRVNELAEVDVPISSELKLRLSIKLTGSRRHIDRDDLRSSIIRLMEDRDLIEGYKLTSAGEDYDFCVSLILTDEINYVGIPLTKMPLSCRPYLSEPRLRPTTCAAMIQIAEIEAGDVVLDPFCGSATLLLESYYSCQRCAIYLAADFMSSSIHTAASNKQHLDRNIYTTDTGFSHPTTAVIDLLTCTAQNLPLTRGVVDVIITDLPFGFKYNIPGPVALFYKKTLCEFNRVLADGGKLALLVNRDHINLVTDSIVGSGLVVSVCHNIDLGKTKACIIKAVKADVV